MRRVLFLLVSAVAILLPSACYGPQTYTPAMLCVSKELIVSKQADFIKIKNGDVYFINSKPENPYEVWVTACIGCTPFRYGVEALSADQALFVRAGDPNYESTLHDFTKFVKH